MRTVKEVIDDWKADCAVNLPDRVGGIYLAVPMANRQRHLLDLCQTLVDEGHDQETIKSVSTRNSIVEVCVPPPEANNPKIKTWRKVVGDQWAMAISLLFKKPVSKFAPKETTQYPVEPKLETKPFDYSQFESIPEEAIQNTQVGYSETIYDEEFFADLGIEPPVKDGK